MRKLIAVSAPSGTGKTTIISEIIKQENLNLMFSVSATSRPPRNYEINGQHYYFLTAEQFKEKIKNNEFVEWQEVYENQFYGTLKTEIERIFELNKNIIFDIDIMGALNIKKHYPQNTITIFVSPPSMEDLKKRLDNRASETPESTLKRLQRAEFEISFAPKFDFKIINDKLETAIEETKEIISNFILEK